MNDNKRQTANPPSSGKSPIRTVIPILLLLSTLVAGSSKGAPTSRIVVPIYTPDTNGFLYNTLTGYLFQEINLPVALFHETNTLFDLKICESVCASVKPPMVVSFQLVSFIFRLPAPTTWFFHLARWEIPRNWSSTEKAFLEGQVPRTRFRSSV
jgi:hypothetical protein